MFIKLYKVILISIISSMLMFGETLAFADTEGKVTGTNDGTGSYQKTNTYDVKASPQDDSAMDIIVSFAIGVIGMKLLMYDKWTPDMMAAAASSGIFIAGAIMNIIQTKKEMNNLKLSLTFREDGKIDSNQVEAIKKEKESWEKAKSSAERLKSLQEYAKFGFMISTGISLYQAFSEEGLHKNCIMAITNSISGLTNLCEASSATPASAETCTDTTQCSLELKSLLKEIEVTSSIEKSSIGKIPSISTEVTVDKSKVVISSTLLDPCGPSSAHLKNIVNSACGSWFNFKKTSNAFTSAFPSFS
jgi:hypothetical protein